MLYMFRTILVHHQEQLYKLYIAFGICRYVWLLCGYSHTTANRRMGGKIELFGEIMNAKFITGQAYALRANPKWVVTK